MTDPLGDALDREVVVWSPKLEADWGRDGYGGEGTVDDLTEQQTGVTVRQSLFDGLPDEVAFLGQSGVPVLSAGLVGRQVDGRDMNATRYFSPFRTDSPLYGVNRDGTPARLEQGPVTSEGAQRTRLFTGQIADLQAPPGAAAALQGVSATRLALSQPVLPPPIISWLYGWGSTEEQLTATWIISWVLHRCGVLPSPPAVPGCIWWFPLHGGYYGFLQDWEHDLQEPIASSGSPIFIGGSFASLPKEEWRQALPRWVRGPYVTGLDAYVTAEAVRHVSLRLAESMLDFDLGRPLDHQRSSPKWFRQDENSGRLQMYVRGDAVDWSVVPTEILEDPLFFPPLPDTWFEHFSGETRPAALEGVSDDVAVWGYVRPVQDSTKGLRLTSSSDDASTPDAAILDITGDIDLRADVTADNWASGAAQTILAKYGVGTQRSYMLRIGSTGVLNLGFTTDGSTDISVNSTVALPFANGERGAVRATLDVDNGSGGRTVRFYTSEFGIDTVAWIELGSAVITAGTVSIHSGSEPLEVGNRGGSTQPFAGTVHAVQVLNGIDGTVVAEAHFEREDPGTTSFVDDAGLTWTLGGGAEIVQDDVPSLAWWIDQTDRKVRLRYTAGQDAYGVESTGALPEDGKWHFLGLAWSISEGRLAINLDGQVDHLEDSGIAATDGDLPGPMTALTSDFDDPNASIALTSFHYLPTSEVQISSGSSDADPVANPVWMRDMEWTQKAHVYPSGINAVASNLSGPREAYELLQGIAQTEVATIHIDGDDEFHYRPPGYYATEEYQSQVETVTTERHIATPNVRLDSTLMRNTIVAHYKRTRRGQQTSALAWYTVLEIPSGVTTYRIPYDFPPEFPPSYGSLFRLLDSTDYFVFDAGLAKVVNAGVFCALNSAADGSGTDIEEGVAVRVVTSQPSALELQFTNSLGFTVYTVNEHADAAGDPIPYIHVGEGIISSDESLVETYDPSVETYGGRTLQVGLPWPLVGSDTEAKQMARRILGAAGLPRTTISRLEIFGDPRRTPGTLMRVQDPQETGLDELLRVDEVEHRIGPDGASYVQSLQLQQSRPVMVWGESNWGESVWAGEENPGIYEEA